MARTETYQAAENSTFPFHTCNFPHSTFRNRSAYNCLLICRTFLSFLASLYRFRFLQVEFDLIEPLKFHIWERNRQTVFPVPTIRLSGEKCQYFQEKLPLWLEGLAPRIGAFNYSVPDKNHIRERDAIPREGKVRDKPGLPSQRGWTSGMIMEGNRREAQGRDNGADAGSISKGGILALWEDGFSDRTASRFTRISAAFR